MRALTTSVLTNNQQQTNKQTNTQPNKHPNPQQVGLKVADLQEASAANRKQLADATREFKRSTAGAAESEYVTAVAALLKRYQEEIDALTRRAKHGE